MNILIPKIVSNPYRITTVREYTEGFRDSSAKMFQTLIVLLQSGNGDRNYTQIKVLVLFQTLIVLLQSGNKLDTNITHTVDYWVSNPYRITTVREFMSLLFVLESNGFKPLSYYYSQGILEHCLKKENSSFQTLIVLLQSGNYYDKDANLEIIKSFKPLSYYYSQGIRIVTWNVLKLHYKSFKPLSYYYSQGIAHILGYEKNGTSFK